MRVMILGGYGVFGGRLATLLSDIATMELLICGRSLERAQSFCATFTGAATATAHAVDRNAIAQHLETLKPDIIVDASGPFQDYGDDPYSVVRAAIAAGVHYLDFADAADFVFGISQFDTDAQKAGVFVLSGASSFPVLTAAVLRRMGRDMEIHSVTGGIAPSPFAGIGLNVMRAVVGYAGGPVTLWRDGRKTTAKGLTETMCYTIAPPGYLPLRNIHFSLVDVPDLQVIPPDHPGLRDIWMGAGPVPETLHRMLNLLARARARLHLPALTPLAPLFYRVLNLMKFGDHRGGMFVEASGEKNGRPHTRSWHMVAEGDDGPLIPSMAIELILRKHLSGDTPTPGARPTHHALELIDYETAFAKRQITAGFRDTLPPEAPLYKHALGPAWHSLPAPLQSLHDLRDHATWQGEATATPASNPIARTIARLIGFPTTARTGPAEVRFTKTAHGELWQRNLDGARFQSVQALGTGRYAGLLIERFGPITVGLALVIEDDKLRLIPRRWTCLGLPLPCWALPGGNSFETSQDGKFQFDVTIEAPLIGRIVSYRGWLEPSGQDANKNAANG